MRSPRAFASLLLPAVTRRIKAFTRFISASERGVVLMPSSATLKCLIEEEMVQLEEEGCDVHITAAEIEQLAHDYWHLRPAAIRLNYGMQRCRGGGSRSCPPRSSAATTCPPTSAWISFIIFIASMMQSTWPTLTSVPISTKGFAPGDGAA